MKMKMRGRRKKIIEKKKKANGNELTTGKKNIRKKEGRNR